MALRTTDTLVKAVLAPGKEYDLVNNPDLTPHMTAANVMVNRVVKMAVDRGIPLDDSGVGSEAEVIERWLSAHFYQQSDRGYTSRSTLSGSGSFQGSATMGLESTFYGQSAMRMDASGMLSALNERKFAQAFRVGTPGGGCR